MWLYKPPDIGLHLGVQGVLFEQSGESKGAQLLHFTP